MIISIDNITSLLRRYRFDLSNEKALQLEIENVLKENNISYLREHRLSKEDIPDFMINDLCIEVKIKGSKKSIFKQIERYSKYNEVTQIILITNKSLGMPLCINNKATSLINLGRAWL